MIIQYANDLDKVSAELLQRKIGGRIVKAEFSPYIQSAEDIVVVSGQIANPTYAYYVSIGAFPNIESSSAGLGFVYVANVGSIKVYGVAGWNRMDTITAVSYIMENGLPPSSIQTGAFNQMHLYTFDFEGVLPTNVVTSLFAIANYVEDHLPVENRLMWYGARENRYVEFLISTNSPAIIWVIGAVLVVAFIVLGIFLWFRGKVTVIDADKNAYVTKLEEENDAREKMIDELGYTPQEAEDALTNFRESFDKGTEGLFSDFTNILKYMMYIAIAGGATYLAISLLQFIPSPSKAKK